MSLKGKRVLVTGAAKHIGREIALTMARGGADVAITFLTSTREAERTLRAVASFGGNAMAVRCDVRDEANVRATVAEVSREFGGLDILINNAGAYETAAFEKITSSQWDNMFSTNVRGPFLMMREAARELRKSKGRIVNLGSLGGMRPWATHAHYCASKAALHMLTQAAAKSLAPEITVNAVAPGMVDQSESNLRMKKRFAEKTPLRRNATAADVVSAVLFLADCSSFITGQVITVDGGLGLE